MGPLRRGPPCALPGSQLQPQPHAHRLGPSLWPQPCCRALLSLLLALHLGCWVPAAEPSLGGTAGNSDYSQAGAPPPSSAEAQQLLGVFRRYPEPSTTTPMLMAAIPGTDKFLFVQEPANETSRALDESSLFDWRTGKSERLPVPRYMHWCGGATLLARGDLLLMGGSYAYWYPHLKDGFGGMEIFNRTTMTWGGYGNMSHNRWYPSATVLPGGKVLITGGTTLPVDTPGLELVTEAEVWWGTEDPTQHGGVQQTANVTLPPHYMAQAGNQYYPTLQLMPKGDALLMWTDTAGSVVALPSLTTSLLDLPPWPSQQDGLLVPPNLHTAYPATSTFVLLPLLPERNYSHEMVLFGGTVMPNTNTTPASSLSLRIGVGDCPPPSEASGGGGARGAPHDGADGAQRRYCVTHGWEVEDMLGVRRVMPDAVLLPNGQVVLVNGAQAGVAGFWTVLHSRAKPPNNELRFSNSTRPALQPLLYDPWAPKGQRYSLLAASPIPRLYHSTACLTPNGTVLVGGCDTSVGYDGPEYDAMRRVGGLDPPTTRREQRMEELVPPCLMRGPRPAISSAPSTIAYDQEFTLDVSVPVPVPEGQADAAGGGSSGSTGGAGAGPGLGRGPAALRVVLVAPCVATHSTNNHQRVVGLQVLEAHELGALRMGTGGGMGRGVRLTARGPPSALPGLALPGWYMVFVVAPGGSYSQAAWVVLQELNSAGSSPSTAPGPKLALGPLLGGATATATATAAAAAATALASSPYVPPFVGLAAAGLPPPDLPTQAPGAKRQQQSPTSAATVFAAVAESGFDLRAYLDYQPQAARAAIDALLLRQPGQQQPGAGDVDGGSGDAAATLVAAVWAKAEAAAGMPPGSTPVCARIPTILSYPAYPGLGAGLYASVTAWALAAALGADVALAPAPFFSGTPAQAQAQAGGAPNSGDVYDAQQVSRMMHELGVVVRIVRWPATGGSSSGRLQRRRALHAAAEPLPAAAPAAAHLDRPLVEVVLNMSGLPLASGAAAAASEAAQPMGLSEVLARAVQAVLSAARGFMAGSGISSNSTSRGNGRGAAKRAGCRRPPAVHLHLASPLLALRTSDLPLAAHLARSLRFSAEVEQEAGRVVGALLLAAGRPGGGAGAGAGAGAVGPVDGGTFNALHIKARPLEVGGNASVDWPALVARCAALGLGPDRPLYVVASWLLRDPDPRAGQRLWAEATQHLAPLGSALLHIGMLRMPRAGAEASAGAGATDGGRGLPLLSAQQAAAVEVEVLTRAERFVGDSGSLLSRFVAQRRLLLGEGAGAGVGDEVRRDRTALLPVGQGLGLRAGCGGALAFPAVVCDASECAPYGGRG